MRLILIAVAAVASAGVAAAAPPTSSTIGTVIKKSKASIKLDCGGKSYKLTTGTGGGMCSITQTDAGKVGVCDDKGGKAGATCADGCVETHGKGDCD